MTKLTNQKRPAAGRKSGLFEDIAFRKRVEKRRKARKAKKARK